MGAAPGTSRLLDPDQQTIIATWAVKTSLLLALSKFRGEDHGWIPVSTLQWLRQHHNSRMPPPGTWVWMAGLSTSDIPASVQAACLYHADREPTAQCVTFSIGCVLFQVFATEQKDADLSPDNEAWLAPTGPYQAALLRIAPSSTPHRWPPRAVFSAGDREALAGRLRRGLPGRPEHSPARTHARPGTAATKPEGRIWFRHVRWPRRQGTRPSRRLCSSKRTLPQ